MSGDEQGDLDGELRRLFADDRLTVPVADGADHAVVVGAHRRRRQRLTVAAAGGVIAVVAVVSVTLGLAGVVRGPVSKVTAAAPPSVTLTTTSAASSSSQAPDDEIEIGPYGLGPVRLGMSMGEVEKTGRSSQQSVIQSYGCVSVGIALYAEPTTAAASTRSGPPGQLSAPPSVPPPSVPPASAVGPMPTATWSVRKPVVITAIVSLKSGVERVGGDVLLRTPEGIGVGSRLADVVAAYGIPAQTQKAEAQTRVVTVPVPGNPTARYEFLLGPDGTVNRVWLENIRYSC